MRNVEDELNLEQVGRMLRIHAKTVKRRIDQGKITAYIDDMSGRLYVERSEVHRILSTKKRYTPPENTGTSDKSRDDAV